MAILYKIEMEKNLYRLDNMHINNDNYQTQAQNVLRSFFRNLFFKKINLLLFILNVFTFVALLQSYYCCPPHNTKTIELFGVRLLVKANQSTCEYRPEQSYYVMESKNRSNESLNLER